MVFQCINIRQVPWEVLKTAASGLGCQHLPRDLVNVNALKTMFDPYIPQLVPIAPPYHWSDCSCSEWLLQDMVRDCVNIGIKHGFSWINIRQVPWEVLKTEAMFDRYYCIKTENICYISRYFLHYFVSPFHRCLANVISTDYARSRAGQNTSRNGSKSVAPVRSYWKLRSRALTARDLPC